LIVLAAGSILAGYAGLGDRFEHFLEPSFSVPAVVSSQNLERAGAEVAEGGPAVTLMVVSSIVAVVGIAIAVFFFLRDRRAADAIARRFSGLYRLLQNKYYVDEIYDAAIVQPIRIASEEGLWKIVDVRVIDGTVNGVGETVSGGGEMLRRLQTGSVRTYAASLFLGVVAILGYYLWR
jgi:NADH-quinone oxidoreductase subunit L